MWNNGAYDVQIHKVIYDEELDSLPTIFDCELKVKKNAFTLLAKISSKPNQKFHWLLLESVNFQLIT